MMSLTWSTWLPYDRVFLLRSLALRHVHEPNQTEDYAFLNGHIRNLICLVKQDSQDWLNGKVLQKMDFRNPKAEYFYPS